MKNLDQVDLSLTMSKVEEAKRLRVAWMRLSQLRLTLGGLIGERRIGPPVCIILEGWDASGKGGSIKRLVTPLDPRHIRIVQYAAPSADEKRHHFLSRFWPALPGKGGMSVYDRSWYGRVLVERVDGFATENEWQRSYKEIRNFERSLIDEGVILIKFWLHLSEAEQLRRFEARAADPLKTWKLTPDDWHNREQRSAYVDAVDEMLQRTSRKHAKWNLISAESKRIARVEVVETTIRKIEKGMKRQGFDPPERE